MTHDPLCPHMPDDSSERICTKCYEHDCECCQCDFIAKVRADERLQAIGELENLAMEMQDWSSAETKAAIYVEPRISAGDWLWAQRGVHRSILMLKVRALMLKVRADERQRTAT